MAMFIAYFDASGHPDDKGPNPAFFVSGFVSTAEKWREFEAEWLALLAEYQIAAPFHMTDFEAGRGQYARLKTDALACATFRSRAILIAKRHTRKGFSSGVVMSDLNRMFSQYDVPASVPRQPYPYCALHLYRLLGRWARNRVDAGDIRLTDQLQIAFEHGDKHRGVLEKEARRRFGIAPLFLKKDGATAFQACDLLSWEHRRWLSAR